MPRRKISFDVAVNTPSAQREADRLANIFQSRLRNVQVGTTAGRGGAGGTAGGGGRGATGGMPGSSIPNLILGSAQFAFAGMFYKFFSDLPGNIMQLNELATVNRRASASFATLAGSTEKANAMIDAYIQGTGGATDRVTATTQAMRLFNIGMADTSEEMRTFTTLTRGMSQALGRDTDYIQEQFSLALANQSLLRFDQLGLSIERHQELVEELSDKYPDLSKELVFQNAMLLQATERYYNLATAQSALATNTEQATTALENLKAIAGQRLSAGFVEPIAGDIAGWLGSTALNLKAADLRGMAGVRQQQAQNLPPQVNAWDKIMGGVFGQSYPGKAQDARDAEIRSLEEVAAVGYRTAEVLDKMQAAQNLGIDVSQDWISVTDGATQAVLNNTATTDDYMGRLDMVSQMIDQAMNPALDDAASALQRTGDSADVMAGKLEGLQDRLTSVAASAIGKLIQAGMSPEEAYAAVGGQARVDEVARLAVEEGALRGSDPLMQEAIQMGAEEALAAPAEAIIDAQQEAERLARRAASAQEQAAKKMEKAIIDASDYIMDTYSDMLSNVPGLFGKSEVTEEDLLLAEKGAAINYADDYLRRVMDVAMNKKDRSDVDLGLVRQALGLDEKTSPEEVAIRFGRAWQSGSLWQNPENIERFLNVGAVRDQLREQEMAALGQQNLRAFFGLGTEQGKEFLRIFGVEALDPIQDGLISEITTRGPIMGETLANSMFQGFKTQALNLPWVQALVVGISDNLTVEMLTQMNVNANSDLAEAEGVAELE
jgi:hypothetical protein